MALQVLEITWPVVLCVNLLDEAEKKEIKVDLEVLSRELGCPVIGAAARGGAGLEQLRERMLREMELAGVPLRELAGHAPEELYQETKDAAETLRQKYDVFQAASEVARHTLECNLRAIEKMQKAQDAPPEEAQPHQADFRV